jgi:hypothetical protein
MVYSVEREERVMAMGQERSKPPLHNFDLPFLKWGNQRHLRCMKLADSSTAAAVVRDNKNETRGGRFPVERHRSSNRSPPTNFGNYDARRSKAPRERFGGVEEGIDAVREKIMLDLKTAANKMKDKILRKEVSDDDSEVEEEQSLQSQSQTPPGAVVPAAEEAPAEQEVRPWNLRTRRAAIGGGGNPISGKVSGNNCSPLRSDSAKSPRLRGDKRDREEKEKERVVFSVPLSKKEIEEDFMAMLGHRPSRRPKKRPRIVQKQMDVSKFREFILYSNYFCFWGLLIRCVFYFGCRLYFLVCGYRRLLLIIIRCRSCRRAERYSLCV